MKALVAIRLKVGDRVECLGRPTVRPSTGESLSAGDVGRVIRVHPIEPANDLLVVDEDTGETYEGENGYARVQWPHWPVGIVWPEDEGVRWRRVTP